MRLTPLQIQPSSMPKVCIDSSSANSPDFQWHLGGKLESTLSPGLNGHDPSPKDLLLEASDKICSRGIVCKLPSVTRPIHPSPLRMVESINSPFVRVKSW